MTTVTLSNLAQWPSSHKPSIGQYVVGQKLSVESSVWSDYVEFFTVTSKILMNHLQFKYNFAIRSQSPKMYTHLLYFKKLLKLTTAARTYVRKFQNSIFFFLIIKFSICPNTKGKTCWETGSSVLNVANGFS